MTHKILKSVLVLFLLLSAAVSTYSAEVSVDLSTTYQTIDGFGGFGGNAAPWHTDYAPFYGDAWLKLVVDNIGMTLMRTEAYPHPEQENAWDRMIPYWKALKAYADSRGEPMKVFATVWTPPSKWKNSNSVGWGRLNMQYKDQYADYLVDYIKRFKNQAGYDLYAIGPANEPQVFDHPFNTCGWEAKDLASLTISLAQKIKTAGLNTLIEISDDLQLHAGYHLDLLRAGIIQDTMVNRIANISSQHYGTNENWPQAFGPYGSASKIYNRTAWNSEFGNGPDTWEFSFKNSRAMYEMLNYGYAAIVYWVIGVNRTARNNSLMGDGRMGPKAYGAKAFFRYIRPGAVRVETKNDNTNLYSLAFAHEDNKTLTLVLLNAGSQQTVTIKDNGSMPSEWDVYLTGNGNNCVKKGTVSPGGTVTIPSNTVATLFNNSSANPFNWRQTSVMSTIEQKRSRYLTDKMNRNTPGMASIQQEHFTINGKRKRLQSAGSQKNANGLSVTIHRDANGKILRQHITTGF